MSWPRPSKPWTPLLYRPKPSTSTTILVANANLEAVLAAQHGVQQARAMLQSALARTESRGVHVRHDHPDMDADQMHHTLVSSDGTTDTLAVRKGVSGHWVLAPTDSA